MKTTSRLAQTNCEQLPRDMVELGTIIASLPAEHRGKPEAAFLRVAESTKRRRRILALVQEALSQLRLDMKYLMFDIEATRRERDELRDDPSQEENDG